MSIAVTRSPVPKVSDELGESSYQRGLSFFSAYEYRSAMIPLVIASAEGHVEAQCLLGIMYARGLGISKTDKNEERGLGMLESAANRGSIRAIREQGLFWKERVQKWSDLEVRSHAAKCFKKAIDSGDEISKEHLRALQEQAPLIIQLRCAELFPGPAHNWENPSA